MYTTKAQICIRRDTAANFTSANPTLALGEIAYETDTRNIKVGDGATAWTALGYINPYRGGTAAAPTSNTVLGSGAGAAMQSGAEDNVLIGLNAGNNITTADGNVFIGKDVGNQTTGSNSVAIGWEAMASSGSAVFNSVAVGYRSLWQATGGNNVAVGLNAETASGSFSGVTAVGASAASLNTANDITAVGANALDANTTGTDNIAVGKDALGTNTTGTRNVAIGNRSGNALSTGQSNTLVGAFCGESITGNQNTAVGDVAMQLASSGNQNTAVGHAALYSNTASGNTAVGYFSQVQTSSGANNTAVGTGSLRTNATGSNSVAVGANALNLSTVSDLTAVGAGALDANTTGTNNTAVGKDALGANTTGENNTALGVGAAIATNTGVQNVAIGRDSLRDASGSSHSNTSIGAFALRVMSSGGDNVAIGMNAGRGSDDITTCNSSIIIGASARPAATSQTNQIVIGNAATGNGSNTTTIGNSSTTEAWMAGRVIPGRHPSFGGSGFGTSGFYLYTSGSDNGGIRGNFVGMDCTGSFAVRSNDASTNRLVVENNGNVTVSNGNLIIGTSGKGIDFAITSEGTGTMTSELLSDYEEGTWTPVYGTTGTGFTTMTMDTTPPAATYTKIGRQVTVRAWIQTDNVNATGATGNLVITGLPFTVAASSWSAGAVGYVLNWAASGFPCNVLSDVSSTRLYLEKRSTSNGQTGFCVPADLTAGANADRNSLMFTCTYFV